MILVKIRKWKEINGLAHEKTTWEVASDPDFKDILETYEESDMTELFFSPIEVPKDVTYYVRAKRHFNSSGVDYWLDPIEVSNVTESYSNMLLAKDPYIAQPYIYLDEKAIISSDAELVLKSSQFISNVDQHESTHWFVLDGNNTILYSSLNNKDNKLELTIPNLAIFKNKNVIKFRLIHRGVSGTESKVGFKDVYLNNELSFEVVSSLLSVPSLTDYKITFKPKKKGDLTNIITVTLVEYANSNNKIVDLPLNNNTVTIPWYYLKVGMKYKIKLLCQTTRPGVNTTVTYDVTVENFSESAIKSPGLEFEFSLNRNNVNNINIPNDLYIESLVGNKLLIPSVEHKKYIVHGYDSSNNEIKTTNRFADGLVLHHTNITNLTIKVLSPTLILIDQLGEDNKPIFLIYNYNINSNVFTKVGEIKRDDETLPIGKTGAIVQTANSEYLYIPPGTKVIKKLNLTTKEAIKVTEVSVAKMDKGLIMKLKNNQVFIANGETYESYVLNTKTLKFTGGFSFGPEDMVNKDNIQINCINGSTLVYKKELVEGEKSNFQYLNYETSMLTNPILKVEGFTASTVLSLNNGNVIFMDRDANGNSNYVTFK